jgi:hypothetical protein
LRKYCNLKIFYIKIKLSYLFYFKSGTGGAVYLESQGTNSQIISNCSFTNCMCSNNGGAIYLQNQPINISNCTFNLNVALGGLGNDVYLSASVSYPLTYITTSCSDSEFPKLNVGSVDTSNLLPTCIEYTDVWLASSTHLLGGVDQSTYGLKLMIILFYFFLTSKKKINKC